MTDNDFEKITLEKNNDIYKVHYGNDIIYINKDRKILNTEVLNNIFKTIIPRDKTIDELTSYEFKPIANLMKKISSIIDKNDNDFVEINMLKLESFKIKQFIMLSIVTLILITILIMIKNNDKTIDIVNHNLSKKG